MCKEVHPIFGEYEHPSEDDIAQIADLVNRVGPMVFAGLNRKLNQRDLMLAITTLPQKSPGIRETDVLYHKYHEEKCSRCRAEFREDEVPLHFWIRTDDEETDAQDMYSFCEKCTPEVLVGSS